MSQRQRERETERQREEKSFGELRKKKDKRFVIDNQ